MMVECAQTSGYQDVQALSSGGFGFAMRARVKPDSEPVVLKTCHNMIDGNTLFQEAKKMETCQHVNIVQLFDLDRINGRVFMTLDCHLLPPASCHLGLDPAYPDRA